MSDIIPYALLPEDPTSEAWLCWIDDRDGADGSEQTVELGNQSASTTGDEIPELSGTYLYSATITDLDPAEDYSGEVDGEETIEYRTCPDGPIIRVGVISDIHPERSAMTDPGPLEELGNLDPNLVLIPGDMLTNRREKTTEHAEAWRDIWFDEYYAALSSNRLMPIFAIPGNHEVDHPWHSENDLDFDPERGHYHFFFKNTHELDPAGKNYAAISVNDSVQVIGLDTFSEEPKNQESWLEAVIDDSHDVIIPFSHNTMFHSAEHSTHYHGNVERYEIAEQMQDHWFKSFYENGVLMYFGGHVHNRHYTTRLGFSDQSEENSLEIDSGYVVEDSDGLIEFGSGWKSTRSYEGDLPDWVHDYADWDSDDHQFYTVDVTNPSVTVTEYDPGGDVYESHNLAGAQRMSISTDSKISIDTDASVSIDVGDSS